MALIRVILNKAMKKVKAFQIPVLIVGAGQTAELVVRQILHDSGMRYQVVGFLEDRHPVDTMLYGFPVLGGFGNMEEVIQETGVHTVLIAAPRPSPGRPVQPDLPRPVLGEAGRRHSEPGGRPHVQCHC